MVQAARSGRQNIAEGSRAASLQNPWDAQEIRKATSGLREKLRWAGGSAPLLAACLPEKGRCR